MVSNSGHDENGKYSGGKAGDQTGTEWQLRAWYAYPKYGWTCVLRYPDSKVGEDLAKVSTAAAKNDLIGYDQGQRGTYYTHLKASNWDPSQITIACEDDCSAGVSANVIAVGYRLNIAKLKTVNPSNTTRSLKAALSNVGFTVLTDAKYLTSDKYLLPGDVLLCEGHHVCVNVSTGSAVNSTTDSSSTTLIHNVVSTSLNVRKGAGTAYSKVDVLSKGTTVTVYEVKNNWYRIGVNRWVSGKYIISTTGKTTANLNCRQGAGTSYKAIKVYDKGSMVVLLSQENGWYMTPDGYISANYVSI